MGNRALSKIRQAEKCIVRSLADLADGLHPRGIERIGVSLHLLAIPFELQPLSPFSQASQLRRVASIGRMPALVLDNGEA
jgi:glutathione S-transferase